MKTVIAALAFTISASAAHAFEPEATFQAVCDSPFVKSEKLQAACAIGETPRVIQDGSRFDARGIGGEVNVLAANLKLILPACATEDSQNCRWNAATQGDGNGRSFVDVAGTIVFD